MRKCFASYRVPHIVIVINITDLQVLEKEPLPPAPKQYPHSLCMFLDWSVCLLLPNPAVGGGQGGHGGGQDGAE